MPDPPPSDQTKPWVTVISPTLTDNAVFRTLAVIKLLAHRFQVQLVGFGKTGDYYAPLAGDQSVAPDLTYHATDVWTWRQRVRAMAPSIRGRAIVCIKPLMPSFGAGLLLGRMLKRPVIVDVDDWETGFLPAGSLDWELRYYGLSWFTQVASPLYIRLLEGRIGNAAAVLVSNTFLQAMFGGHWVPHLRDMDQFRTPNAPKPPGRKIVSFIGKPRAHKGLSTLIAAWRAHPREDALLRLVVPDRNDEELTRLVAGLPNVELTGPFPFVELPRLLAESSVVVVPQSNERGAVGQLPVKMLDAMASGRPIVATDVCDASRWLADGAGMIVTPGSVPDLAAAIGFLLDHPAAAEEMGVRARARLVELASESRLSSLLCDIVDAAVEGRVLPMAPAFAGARRTPYASTS